MTAYKPDLYVDHTVEILVGLIIMWFVVIYFRFIY